MFYNFYFIILNKYVMICRTLIWLGSLREKFFDFALFSDLKLYWKWQNLLSLRPYLWHKKVSQPSTVRSGLGLSADTMENGKPPVFLFVCFDYLGLSVPISTRWLWVILIPIQECDRVCFEFDPSRCGHLYPPHNMVYDIFSIQFRSLFSHVKVVAS